MNDAAGLHTPDPDAVAALLRRRLTATGPMMLPVSGSSMGRMIPSGSEVKVMACAAPRPGEVWAVVDDDGEIIVHVARHVSTELMVGRGRSNEVDDRPVGRHRLIGRAVEVVDPSGRRKVFGERSRFFNRLEFSARGLLRTILRRW